jgi:hypothetical protein
MPCIPGLGPSGRLPEAYPGYASLPRPQYLQLKAPGDHGAVAGGPVHQVSLVPRKLVFSQCPGLAHDIPCPGLARDTSLWWLYEVKSRLEAENGFLEHIDTLCSILCGFSVSLFPLLRRAGGTKVQLVYITRVDRAILRDEKFKNQHTMQGAKDNLYPQDCYSCHHWDLNVGTSVGQRVRAP